MQTVLVPLDGSLYSEQALPYAQLLARTLMCKVRLLHVLTEVDREEVITSGLVSRHAVEGMLEFYDELAQPAWELLRQHAEIYLAGVADRLRAAELAVETQVRIGALAESIVDAVREPETLIVMATHGWSGLRRWVIGSVTDAVVQTTTTPILVVQSAPLTAPRTAQLRRILVPLDGSEHAARALPLALDLARRAHAELVLLQAVVPQFHSAGVFMVQRNRALEALRARAEVLRREYPAIKTVVAGEYAHAAEAIVDEAAGRQADLIVMATHGYGGARRWMLGSVANKVLHATTVPVLFVRPQPGTEAQEAGRRPSGTSDS
jgi:nucleotide-binding universal stress UspA family protein